MSLELIMDVLVAVLLIFTIAYAIVLNKRLGALRKDKTDLEKLAGTFGQATVRAEESIGRLKITADALQDRIEKAEALRDDLSFLIDRGGSAADRLETVVRQARKEGELQAVQPAQEYRREELMVQERQKGVETRDADSSVRETGSISPPGSGLDDEGKAGPRSEAERELLKALQAAR